MDLNKGLSLYQFLGKCFKELFKHILALFPLPVVCTGYCVGHTDAGRMDARVLGLGAWQPCWQKEAEVGEGFASVAGWQFGVREVLFVPSSTLYHAVVPHE